MYKWNLYKKEPIYKVQTFRLKKAWFQTIPAYIYIKSNTTALNTERFTLTFSDID